MIYLLYGQPDSGKTTLGNLLAKHLDTPFIIDGDEFRSFFLNIDYGYDGRKKNIQGANAVATYLNKKSSPHGHVVMSLVNPYEKFRSDLRENNKGQVVEVLLLSKERMRKRQFHVENFEEGKPEYIINTDREVEESWLQLKGLLKLC